MPDPFISTIARPVPLDPVLEVSYMHIRYIDHAKIGIREHIGILSGIKIKNCLPEASVGYAV